MVMEMNTAPIQIEEVKCTDERPCINCFSGSGNCLKTINGHTVDCLYEFDLGFFNLKDTPDMRVLFWSAHQAIQFDTKEDKHIVPDFKPDDCPCCGRGKNCEKA